MKSGCAPDLFAFAAVLDVPFRVEDTCATTGKPIRIDFVPDGYQRTDPPETVTLLLSVGQVATVAGGTIEQVNAKRLYLPAVLRLRQGSRTHAGRPPRKPDLHHPGDVLTVLVHLPPRPPPALIHATNRV